MEFNGNIVSLRQLRVLYLLVEYGSVSRVANILDITQPAVSRLLTALENDSPYALFTRKKNKLIPTSYAIELSEMVRPILKDVETLSNRFYSQDQDEDPNLNIALASNASIVFAGALASFHNRTAGKVNVNAHFTAQENVVMQVTEQQSDLGIIAYNVPTTGEVEVIKFVDSKVCCVVNCNHILSTKETIAFMDLQDQNIIVSSHAGGNTRRQIEQGLKQANVSDGITYGVDTFVACDLVRRGVGVALISELTAKTFFRDNFEVAIIPLADTILQPFSWIVPTTKQPTKNMLMLMEEMNSFIKDVLEDS